MKKITHKQTLGFALLTLLLVACSTNEKEASKNAAGAPAPAALPVDVTIAKTSSLVQNETIAGTVIANQTVDITSELSKKIVAVYFKDGSYVSKGQPLYKLDDADTRARIHQVSADLQLAKLNAERMGELFKSESVRREEYDAALARLKYLEASLELLQVELSKTIIRAPFPGIAGITKVFPGAFVSPGLPLVSLQEQASMKIKFTVSEKYLALVKPGKIIHFSTELNEQPGIAKIVSAESSVDMQSRSITVLASIAGNSLLKPGMSAKVFFNTAGANQTGINVPTEALVPGANGYSVFVIKNGAATIKQVSISNRDEKQAVISSGIAEGDSIIISNILRAGEGVPVSIATTN
jgi:membrane fusion protein (multidrug efflux system)